MEIDILLKLMLEKGASDLHLKVPSQPSLRIDGKMAPLFDMPRLASQDMESFFNQITNDEQRAGYPGCSQSV
jgi:twitching motility protein PilT